MRIGDILEGPTAMWRVVHIEHAGFLLCDCVDDETITRYLFHESELCEPADVNFDKVMRDK